MYLFPHLEMEHINAEHVLIMWRGCIRGAYSSISPNTPNYQHPWMDDRWLEQEIISRESSFSSFSLSLFLSLLCFAHAHAIAEHCVCLCAPRACVVRCLCCADIVQRTRSNLVTCSLSLRTLFVRSRWSGLADPLVCLLLLAGKPKIPTTQHHCITCWLLVVLLAGRLLKYSLPRYTIPGP